MAPGLVRGWVFILLFKDSEYHSKVSSRLLRDAVMLLLYLLILPPSLSNPLSPAQCPTRAESGSAAQKNRWISF